MSFVHLHVHSQYSLLDGLSDLKKLVRRAKEMNMPAIALTDHGSMYGVIEFFNAAQAEGIKPIIGLEAYVAARGMKDRDVKLDKRSHHLLLLAENQVGYQNLLKIASAAQTEGFYYYPRIDHAFLENHAEGLIATSGCMSAEVPRALRDHGVERAFPLLDWYYKVFGEKNFYLELQRHDIPELEDINKNLIEMGKRYNAKFIATNDVHYINREDARLQDFLLAIQTGALISDPKRFRMSVDTFYLRSPEEMAALFAEVPDALSNTLEIAERCNVNLSNKGYHLPRFPVPEGYTVESFLCELCEEGLRKRYGDEGACEQKVRERLDYELGIIHNMGFDAYFLIVWDLCRFAREENIWYNVRGSGAGSMVAYTLDITRIEPLGYGLIFERFLNPDRISMPDIDLDFQDDLRSKMLEYCAQKYGNDRVAQIITFGTMGVKAAIRDVGRVMDIPLSEVDRVAKLIPLKASTMSEAFEQSPELKKVYDETEYLQDLIDTAGKMTGVVRNAGTHAAGVVITDEPVINYVPLNRPTSGSEDSPIKTVTQFEMSIIESLGLLKVDFLGLRTLTIMARACRFIEERHQQKLSLNDIPIDDKATFEFISKGHTAGVFQLEGNGMTRYVIQMQPQNVNNLIAMVALYRPGPLEFIPQYIRRMHGEERVEYKHPALEPIFSETFGIAVYQEQIMRASVEIAGYKMSESDELRKAISKKQKDKLEKHKHKFIKGAAARGVMDEATAAAIFGDWEEFARYGFNKAHAADYGVISVQTGYLKCHFTVEYMTALLSAEKNDITKVAFYVEDCRSMGVQVLSPGINSSEWDFSIEDCTPEGKPLEKPVIRFGMGAIKNVGQNSVEIILEARRKGGSFRTLTDFIHRVDLRAVGKRSLECLIKVGALDGFGSRRALLDCMDQMIALSTSHFKAAQSGQISIFGTFAEISDDFSLPQVEMLDHREQLEWEHELLGLYVSSHPLSPYLPLLRKKVTHFSRELNEARPKERVTVAGMVTKFRPYTTKDGKMMGFITLEDTQGPIELLLFARTWEKYSKLVAPDKVLIAEGRADTESSEPKVLVDRLIEVDLSEVPVENEESSANSYTQAIPSRIADLAEEIKVASRHAVSPIDDPWEDEGADDWHLREPEGEELLMATSAIAMNATAIAVKAIESDNIEEKSEEIILIRETFSVDEEIYTQPEKTETANEVAEPMTEAYETTAQPVSSSMIESGRLFPLPPAVAPRMIQTPASTLYPEEEERGNIQQPTLFAPMPFLLSPNLETTETADARMVTIVLHSTGDKTRDRLRMNRIYGILTSCPGKDKYAFLVFEHNRRYLLEFPNDTTGISSALLKKLIKVAGEGNVSVDKINIQ